MTMLPKADISSFGCSKRKGHRFHRGHQYAFHGIAKKYFRLLHIELLYFGFRTQVDDCLLNRLLLQTLLQLRLKLFKLRHFHVAYIV